MRDTPTKITQDTKKVTIVDLSESRNKLTQNMYRVWNVRPRDTKVNKTPYNVMITSRILKRLTISGFKVKIKLHESLRSRWSIREAWLRRCWIYFSWDKNNPSGVEEISILRKYLRGSRSDIRN
jgi:hypothetical protein